MVTIPYSFAPRWRSRVQCPNRRRCARLLGPSGPSVGCVRDSRSGVTERRRDQGSEGSNPSPPTLSRGGGGTGKTHWACSSQHPSRLVNGKKPEQVVGGVRPAGIACHAPSSSSRNRPTIARAPANAPVATARTRAIVAALASTSRLRSSRATVRHPCVTCHGALVVTAGGHPLFRVLAARAIEQGVLS